MAKEPEPFTPQDTMANAVKVCMQTTAAGAVLAGVQNALRKQNVGMSGIITHSGGMIAAFAAAGFTYRFTLDSAANLRQKDDAYNYAIAGFIAGALPIMPRNTLPGMLGAGTFTAVVMATFKYTQGFRPPQHATEEDEYERRERIKRNRRRPIEETISELGEGRGIYAPGWEERRAERIKEKYGIDVTAVPPTRNTPA